MHRVTCPVFMFLALAPHASAQAPGDALDDACESVGALEDYEMIAPGDVVYLDTDGKKKFRVARIDEEFEEICDARTCYDAFDVFTADAVAACAAAGLSPQSYGAIYLYGDDEDDEDE